MTAIRDNWNQFKNLFGVLWYWGTFPLSFVTYAAVAFLALGVLIGRLLP
jgi:hypothetical protein